MPKNIKLNSKPKSKKKKPFNLANSYPSLNTKKTNRPKKKPSSLFLIILSTNLIATIIGSSLTLGLFLYFKPKQTPKAPLTPPTSALLSNHQSSRLNQNQEKQLINTVDQTIKSVVTIKVIPLTTTKEPLEQDNQTNPFGELFGQNFKINPFKFNSQSEKLLELSGGSGFIISSTGIVVTNKHVIDYPHSKYLIYLQTGQEFEAELIDKDPTLDLAFLKIITPQPNFKALELTNSDLLKVGQTTIAIGNALGEFKNSVSVGIISGLGRSIITGSTWGQNEYLDEVIQTDAAINLGNSGGPLLNSNGQVIGINVAIAQNGQNISFALPANLIKLTFDSIKKHGKIIRPFIGIRYSIITPQLQAQLNLPFSAGILISSSDNNQPPGISPDSPAEKSGLKEGDVITHINNQLIDARHHLASLVRKYQVGETLNLKISRDGVAKQIQLTLSSFPSSKPATPIVDKKTFKIKE